MVCEEFSIIIMRKKMHKTSEIRRKNRRFKEEKRER